jgi:hypothetical protein
MEAPLPARVSPRLILKLILVTILATTLSGCAELLKDLLTSPYITTKKLPNGVVGVPYTGKVNASFDLLASWWISDGQLPPGLVFKDSRISGTPIAGGTFKFEVTVSTGSESINQDSKRFTVLILDIATQTLPDGSVDQSYGPLTLEAVGQTGTPSWSIVSGNLPDGISLTGTGVLSGTPASAGTFPFTVKVTDQGVPSRSQTRNLSLTVLNQVPTSTLLSPNFVAIGDPSFDLVVNGSDFVTTSVVIWNGADRPTTYVSSTQLIASIPASDLSTSGTAGVAVRTPPPHGGLSNSLVFDIAPASSSSFALERVSVDTQGNQANGPSGRPSISDSGRYIVFESSASNLVPEDSNGASDIFLRDTCRNAESECRPVTVRVSLTNESTEANGPSYRPSISGNGRYVAFASQASNLIPEDTNSIPDIFVRDTCMGGDQKCEPATFRISVGPLDAEPNGASDFPLLSATGRYVVFSSEASNLVSEDTNESEDIFIHDSCLGAAEPCFASTVRVSVDEQEREFRAASSTPRFSSGGRFVMFTVGAASSAPATRLAYLRDTCLSIAPECLPSTKLISTRNSFNQQTFESSPPHLSSNGRFVAFAVDSDSTPDESKGTALVIREVCKGEQVTCDASIVHLPPVRTALAHGATSAAIPSNSGRYVAFISRASNLVPDDLNEFADVFVSDTCFGSSACIPATWRVSRGKSGLESDADSAELVCSPDGKALAFTTAATTLDPDDTNGVSDVFVYFSPDAETAPTLSPMRAVQIPSVRNPR